MSTLVTGFNITSDQMRSRVDIVVSRNVKGGRLPSPPVEDLPDDYRMALLEWLLPAWTTARLTIPPAQQGGTIPLPPLTDLVRSIHG